MVVQEDTRHGWNHLAEAVVEEHHVQRPHRGDVAAQMWQNIENNDRLFNGNAFLPEGLYILRNDRAEHL